MKKPKSQHKFITRENFISEPYLAADVIKTSYQELCAAVRVVKGEAKTWSFTYAKGLLLETRDWFASSLNTPFSFKWCAEVSHANTNLIKRKALEVADVFGNGTIKKAS